MRSEPVWQAGLFIVPIFGHLQQWKFAQKPSKIAKSGHTDLNLLTLPSQ